MANDMKQVGLVFKADGSVDFKNSVSQINAELQKNRNEFKLTKLAYDEHVKSSTKLKDTQKYLSKQYEESSKKVELLSDELKELENDENASQKAIEKKEKQLMSAKLQMQTYKNGLDEVNKTLKKGTADIEDYAKKLQDTGGKISSVGKTVSKGLTVPIAAVGTAAMVAWNELDEAYDGIVAGTGATGDDLNELYVVFDEVFGSMPVEASEASTAIADLNTRFGFTNDKLQEASVKFLKFANVNNTDVSTAIALVSRAMGDAGIESDNYASLLDDLTAASQASGISIDKLTEMLTKYGAPMRQLGFDTQQSIALFAQWEKAGVNTEIAFSGMKKAISNWSSSGKDARVEFTKTLKEIERCPTLAKATTKAIEIFGAKAGPDLADAIKGGRFSVEEMTKVVENAGGIVEQSFSDMEDPIDKSKVALNNLKLVGADLGNEIQGTLAPVLEMLSDVLKSIFTWFKSLDPSIKQFIVVVGLLLLAIGPLIIVIGTLVSAFGNIMLALTPLIGAVNQAGGIISFLSSSLGGLLSPIGAVIAIIALLTATFIDLWNTSEDFRNAVIEIWNSISSVMKTLYDTVLKPILDMLKIAIIDVWNSSLKPLWDSWKSFVYSIIQLMNDLLKKIQPILNWFIQTFGPLFVGVFSASIIGIRAAIGTITSIIEGLLNSVKLIVNGMKQVFNGIVDFITGVFTGNWRKAWQGVVNVFKGIINTIKGIFSVPINACIGIMNGLIGGINTMIRGLNKIKFDTPDWIPVIGGKHFGFSIPTLGKIPYMQFGGELLRGTAIVGEAGAEMLQQTSRGTRVIPLTDSGGTNKHDIIDYEKLALIMIKAIQSLDLKATIDGRVLVRWLKENYA